MKILEVILEKKFKGFKCSSGPNKGSRVQKISQCFGSNTGSTGGSSSRKTPAKTVKKTKTPKQTSVIDQTLLKLPQTSDRITGAQHANGVVQVRILTKGMDRQRANHMATQLLAMLKAKHPEVQQIRLVNPADKLVAIA